MLFILYYNLKLFLDDNQNNSPILLQSNRLKLKSTSFNKNETIRQTDAMKRAIKLRILPSSLDLPLLSGTLRNTYI